MTAAERLPGEVGGRAVAPRAVEPERAQRGDDDARPLAPEPPGGEARIVGDRGAGRPDDDLGVVEQRVDQADVGVGVRRRDHAVLRGRQEAEEGAVLTGWDRGAALRLAPERVAGVVLDLHHVGAAVGQQLGAVRTRQAAREVDHPGADQRPGIAHPGDRNRRTGGTGQASPDRVRPSPFPAPPVGGWLGACRSSAGGERGVDLGPGGAAGEVAGLVAARPPGRRDGRGGGRGVGRRSPHRRRGPELCGRRAHPDCGVARQRPRVRPGATTSGHAPPRGHEGLPVHGGHRHRGLPAAEAGRGQRVLVPRGPRVDLRADRATGGGAPPRSGARRRDRRRRERPRPLPPRPRCDDGDRAVEPRPGPAAVRAAGRRRAVPAEAARGRHRQVGVERPRLDPVERLLRQVRRAHAPDRQPVRRPPRRCEGDPRLRGACRSHPRAPGERRGLQRPLRHPEGEERHRPRARRADPVRGGRPRRWWRVGGPGAGAGGVGQRGRPADVARHRCRPPPGHARARAAEHRHRGRGGADHGRRRHRAVVALPAGERARLRPRPRDPRRLVRARHRRRRRGRRAPRDRGGRGVVASSTVARRSTPGPPCSITCSRP